MVFLHDLQLIGELVETPAEFLLYLRRRRDAETARYFMAPDELDLFCTYSLNEGLYVPPDPARVQQELRVMRPDHGSRRRRSKLVRQLITTRRTLSIAGTRASSTWICHQSPTATAVLPP